MSVHRVVPLGPDARRQETFREPEWFAWRSALRRVMGVVMVALSIVPVAGFLAVRWLARRRHPATSWALLLAAGSFVASVFLVALAQ